MGSVADRDGFVVEQGALGAIMHGRFGGEAVRIERYDGRVRYSGEGFDLALDPADVAGSVSGAADGPVDLTRLGSCCRSSMRSRGRGR